MPATRKKNTTSDKDSPTRSLLKAISWRILASGTTFIISYFIFKRYTDKPTIEVFQTASTITAIELFAKLFIYYVHERVWTNISWGKYWRKRAWRRKYRKLHRKMNNSVS